MLPYYFMCRNNTENLDTKVRKAKNGRTTLSSEFSPCNSKTSRFMEEREGSKLLINLGIETPLSNIPLLGKFLF